MRFPGLRALLADRRLLAFGFLMAFASSAGQTYFISLFSQEFRDAFGLGHAGFGAVYSAATLTSGLLLTWAGGLIDRLDLRLFAAGVLAGLALAAGGVSGAAGPVTLGVSIFLLRFFGQGLASHTAVTATARYADPAVRGKAVSVATLGFPAGEALCPVLVVAAIATLGWRQTYGGTALLVLMLILPVALLMLAGHGDRHAALIGRTAGGDGSDGIRQWTRGEVLRDRVFHRVLVAAMAPSFIVTGVLFHQVHLSEVKGWSLALFAGGYIGYAAFQVGTALVAGPVIDRIGARRTSRFYLAPLGLGLVVLAAFDPIWSGYLFLMSAGATAGFSSTLLGTLWAELYGVRHLGAIRALVTACSVVASALSPVLLGVLLDLGVSIEAIALGCAAYVGLGVVVLARMFAPSAYGVAG